MIGIGKRLVAIAPALVLAACGLPAPSTSLLNAQCPPPLTEPGEPGASDMFVMSSSLLDCRRTPITFAKYRNHRAYPGEPGRTVSYAVTSLEGPDDRPWTAQNTRLYAARAWRAALSERINAAGNEGRLLVFIHGYNNDFEDALARGTIIRRLSRGNTPTVVVSWPSRNRLQSYVYDEASIAWAQDYISDLVEDLAGVATDITIVSHSMGGRALIAAVERLEFRDPGKAKHITSAILVAPDIDRHRVLRPNGSLDTLLGSQRKVVIYTSQKDFPIRASRMLHGYARLGSSDCRYDVDYARRARGRHGNCHWTGLRDRFEIVETARTSDDFGLRHADVFDTCAGRYDLRTFLHGKDSFPWRERQGNESAGGAVILPDYFRDRPELCQEVAGLR